jgi:regulator of protease activity HflC (stomatin/prohibitin superfamily)
MVMKMLETFGIMLWNTLCSLVSLFASTVVVVVAVIAVFVVIIATIMIAFKVWGKIQDDGWKKAIRSQIPLAINILATILVAWVCYILPQNTIPYYQTLIMGMIIWGGVYIGWGLTIVQTNEYIVVERLGTFYRIAEDGLKVLCLPGLIDRIPKNGKGSYKGKGMPLYQEKKDDEGVVKDNAIDFADGVTAPIKATIFYQLEKPTTPIGPTEHPGYKWLYTFENPEDRIQEVVDATLRPILEGKDFDEAKKDLKSISLEVIGTQAIKNSLAQMGAVLHPEKGLLITDIVLSSEMIALRAKVQEGEAEAKKQEKQGEGYGKAIKAIRDASLEVLACDIVTGKPTKWGEPTISFSEAKAIYEQQRALETLGKTGSNVTFVSPDLKGSVNLMLGAGGSNKQPSGDQGGHPRKKK